jgi:hypothetical protein
MAGMGVSLGCAFVYRYASVCENAELMQRKSAIFVMILAHLLYGLPISTSVLYVNDGYERRMRQVQLVCFC